MIGFAPEDQGGVRSEASLPIQSVRWVWASPQSEAPGTQAELPHGLDERGPWLPAQFSAQASAQP